jgi:hypothetical protein
MTNLATLEAEDVLSSVDALRRRVRSDRSLHWLPLALFSVLTLASAPLYYRWQSSFPQAEPCYRSSGLHVLTCAGYDHLPASGILTQGFTLNSLGGWLSFYWIAGLIMVSLVIAQWYRSRSNRIGLRMHRWPIVVTTLSLLAIAWIKSSPANIRPPFFASSHLWDAGATPLWIVVIGLWILAWQERSITSVVFAVGFSAIVWGVSEYPAARFLRWDGLGGWVTNSNFDVYTVVLPGIYLFLGALFASARWHDQRRRLGQRGY